MAHFEIHLTDVPAGRTFYTGLFGWEFEAMAGAEEVEYALAKGDGLGGDLTIGVLKRADTAHPAGSAIRGGTMTFEAENCDQSYAWALEHGGAEALPPMDYPGVGRCAYVEDGQGNVVGMITPAGGVN